MPQLVSIQIPQAPPSPAKQFSAPTPRTDGFKKILANRSKETAAKDEQGPAKSTDQTKPKDQTNPADQTEPVDQAKPADEANPADQTNPAEKKPVDQKKSADQVKSADQAKSADETKPTDQTRPTDSTNLADIAAADAEQVVKTGTGDVQGLAIPTEMKTKPDRSVRPKNGDTRSTDDTANAKGNENVTPAAGALPVLPVNDVQDGTGDAAEKSSVVKEKPADDKAAARAKTDSTVATQSAVVQAAATGNVALKVEQKAQDAGEDNSSKTLPAAPNTKTTPGDAARPQTEKAAVSGKPFDAATAKAGQKAAPTADPKDVTAQVVASEKQLDGGDQTADVDQSANDVVADASAAAVKTASGKNKAAQPTVADEQPQDQVGQKPEVKAKVTTADVQQLPAAATSAVAQDSGDDASPRISDADAAVKKSADLAKIAASIDPSAGKTQSQGTAKSNAPALMPVTPEAQFAEANHPKIVTSVRGELMPHGGTMQIRLDPPELGALNVTVKIKDGVVTASFETSNPEATRMLAKGLSDLKSGLEAAGVTVDKIHVQQGSKDFGQSQSDDERRGQQQNQDASANRDQQRKEMLRRMWRKVSGGVDPVDLVA